MPQRGWRPVPRSHPAFSPTSRRYFDPANRVRTRYQFDTHRLQQAGWESRSDFDRRFESVRKNRGYERWVKEAEKNLGLSKAQISRSDSEFNRAFLRARDDDFSNDPDGTFADFLVLIGLRQDDWEFDIGDTPET